MLVLLLFDPITIVDNPSIIAECSFVLKSMETNGSSVISKIPSKSPFAACLKCYLLHLLLHLLKSTTKSTNETFGVGTRNDIPCNLPFNWGNTIA